MLKMRISERLRLVQHVLAALIRHPRGAPIAVY